MGEKCIYYPCSGQSQHQDSIWGILAVVIALLVILSAMQDIKDDY